MVLSKPLPRRKPNGPAPECPTYLPQSRSFSHKSCCREGDVERGCSRVQRQPQDRPSRPHRSPRQTPAQLVEQVLLLRRQRWTGVRIAQTTALSRATVSRILRRHWLSRMRDLAPPVPVRRYEHPFPGDLLHLDTKKLARIAKPGHRLTGDPRDETRGAGWEMLHVAIDDHSRIAFSQLQSDEPAPSTVAFLGAAVAYYARFGIPIRRVLTDNAPCYCSRL